MPWLRRLVAGLLPRRTVFDPLSVHVIFVVDTMAVEQVFLRLYRFSPIFPPVFHNRLRIHVALTRRSKGRSLGILQKQWCVGNLVAFNRKVLHFLKTIHLSNVSLYSAVFSSDINNYNKNRAHFSVQSFNEIHL